MRGLRDGRIKLFFSSEVTERRAKAPRRLSRLAGVLTASALALGGSLVATAPAMAADTILVTGQVEFSDAFTLVEVAAWDGGNTGQTYGEFDQDGNFAIEVDLDNPFMVVATIADDEWTAWSYDGDPNTYLWNPYGSDTATRYVNDGNDISGLELELSVPLQPWYEPTISSDYGSVGSEFTANTEDLFTNSNVESTLQWYASDDAEGTSRVAIEGATGSTFTATADEFEKYLTVVATGTKPGYEPTVHSSTTNYTVYEGEQSMGEVAISGTATVGNTLTAVTTGFDPDAELTYQWSTGDGDIEGATGSTLVVTPDLQGAYIWVYVSATQPGYYPIEFVGPEEFAGPVPYLEVTSSVPTITGTPKYGSVLTAKAGTWGPQGVTLSYQWYGEWSGLIKGATKSTYKASGTDVGQRLSVQVTGTFEGYDQRSQWSNWSKPVAGLKFTAAATPKISGTAKVGKTLKVSVGTWKPSGVKFAYQWYANGKPIKNAYKSSYKIAKAYKGKKITVSVYGYKTGYNSLVKVSKATSKVK